MTTGRVSMGRAALYAVSGGFLTVAFGVLGAQDADAAAKPPAVKPPVVVPKAVEAAAKPAAKKAPATEAKRVAKPKPLAQKTTKPKPVPKPQAKRVPKPKPRLVPVPQAKRIPKPKPVLKPKAVPKPAALVKQAARTQPKPITQAKRAPKTTKPFTTKPAAAKQASKPKAAKPLPQSVRLAEAAAERQAKTDRQFQDKKQKATQELQRTASARAAYAESQRGGAPGSGLTRRIAEAKQKQVRPAHETPLRQVAAVKQAPAPRPEPERRKPNSQLDRAEDQAERQALTERQFQELHAVNGQPLRTPSAASLNAPIVPPRLVPVTTTGQAAGEAQRVFWSSPTGRRATGEIASLAARTLDNPADAAIDAGTSLVGGLVEAVGAVTGNDTVKAAGQVTQAISDEIGDGVGDAVMQAGVDARNEAYRQAEAEDGTKYAYEVYVSSSRHPESALHVTQAQNGVVWQGGTWTSETAKPKLLTLDRGGAKKRRQQSLQGIKPGSKVGRPGDDRDEYPFAVSAEGGKQPDGSRSSVKYIPEKDNSGAGGRLPSQLRPLGNGDQFLVLTTD
ncbi:NucA/NucB deoxyribonuclease domain-containing protein [Umezawaea sp. Da 62-37]|uniref:NucA/NucB deoxyribonuclease domain-containing protein n=1 Tax=Umezawaea sp. Da 62-37 TaxID=3075927 RepID=UPI0028F6ECA5|nr:NucA/NucB deoxyribonuclease domain-containing protein [Umezawaea sp. Da 62-37]WNV87059.1 NucA/NucB deoxyribonuclease domain-containing protein [Umezawaea sp. Da 62-37]